MKPASTLDAQERETGARRRIIATAERLFREIGFQKTTVADIARELRMSPANVYRFFGAKSEINAAVAQSLMDEVERGLEAIARRNVPAADRLRAIVLANEEMNAARYTADRKLHDMVEAALVENWPSVSAHIDRINAILADVVADGMRNGEFAPGDALRAAALVNLACVRFFHPRLIVECADRPEPSSAQMIDFCLAALRAGPPR